MKAKVKLDWRLAWYSVLIWFLAIIISGFVILPWFYIVMPVVIFWTTIVYFKKPILEFLGDGKGKRQNDQILTLGLWVSIFWFLAVAILNVLEIIGPYYANVFFYFSDFRNWFLYPLILLVPVVYSLILENWRLRRNLKRKRSTPARITSNLRFG